MTMHDADVSNRTHTPHTDHTRDPYLFALHFVAEVAAAQEGQHLELLLGDQLQFVLHPQDLLLHPLSLPPVG
jgi:hypothetical protein